MDVVVFKTRTCTLCEKALLVLARRRRRFGLAIRVVPIDDRPDLLRLFATEVPVVFVAGRKRFMGRVDPGLLAREVEAARRSHRLSP